LRYRITIRNLFTFFLFVFVTEAKSQSAVLSTGKWYKVAIEKNGVYKISFNDFKKMGFDAAAIDPRKIKIFGNEGGMLPQANSAARPADLTENAIFVQGEDDGVFNSGDYIIWYAEGPDLVQYDVQRSIFKYESNLYSTQNFYFITIGSENGKRVTTVPSIAGTFPAIQSFNDYIYHETDTYNALKSGREWFERINLDQQAYTTSIAGIVDNSAIRVVSDVMGQSTATSSFQLSWNNVTIAQQSISSITDSQYGIKGVHKRDTIPTNASTVGASSATNQEIKYIYTKTGSGSGYLDFFLLNVERKLTLYGDQTIFRSRASLNNTTSTFEIENANSNTLIWNITNPYEPSLQQYTLQGSKASFSTTTESLKEFIVFTTNIPAPVLIGSIANQNLHGLSTPNLVIIAHPDFKQEALRLASHREAHSGWTTAVVTPEEVYNEFSSGKQDVSAIRDFMKHLYDKGPSILKALLLVGKSSYDYKDRVSNNTNYVATYESRNSLTPLETYSSDDYFGFLENSEGNWSEGISPENHSLEIGVGRLPVKTAEEAKNVIDKIIDYDTNKKTFGSWRKNIVFVADDGSNSDFYTSTHQSQANTLANTIESAQAGLNAKKIFLGTYTKTVKPNGESIPEATEDIIDNFDRGALIINYTGHGNERVWTDEQVFTNFNIDELENTRYPFLVTATCEFGRQDDPAQISSAELSVLHPNGGAIGLVTTARPVYSFTNFELNKAFYEALFEKESGRYIPMGEVFRRTKNNSISGVGNRNFSLLGDPSMTLAMPPLSVSITDIKTTTGSDTLKALSTAVVKGEIVHGDGSLYEDFNGTLEATLFDKQTDFVTIGKNNPAFSYKEWYNILFRGKASVKNGAFEFKFIVPKNMAYEIAPGKLSLYAADSSQSLDAAGATSDFKIGNSEKNPAADNTPPAIHLYMGDTTFINGGIVSPDVTLLARLQDASGINVSAYGIGNNLVAVLDNDEIYPVSDYYIADQDDFTKGWINFPIKDLTPGKHSIILKAWDTYNNPAEARIDFRVTDGEDLKIETFANYPNPFETETTLYFTHNRSGDDLEAQLSIYSMTGQQLLAYSFSITESSYKVELMKFDGLTDLGKKLQPGLYLARVAVRSITNGSKNERLTKLIVVN
jgi:hypothetical protein